jgi:hypothetical protein
VRGDLCRSELCRGELCLVNCRRIQYQMYVQVMCHEQAQAHEMYKLDYNLDKI